MRLLYRSEETRAAISFEKADSFTGNDSDLDFIKQVLDCIPFPKEDEDYKLILILADTADEARALMREFGRQARAVYSGEMEEMHPSLLSWGAGFLESLGCDDRPIARKTVEYFHVRMKGRPTQNRARDVNIVQEVEMRRRGGQSMMESCAEVADEFGLEESVVKKIYLRLRTEVFVDENGEVELPF